MDAAVAQRRQKRRDVLAEIVALVDWLPIERLLGAIPVAAKGEPSYPPLTMFKVLLLQRWHDLSDEAMEAALFDRLSFQRFAGLSLDDPVPDHSTIWRFRELLGSKGLIEPLLAELARQLDARGVLVKQGTLIDASIVTSAARRPRMEEGRVSAVDPDARFGTANERGRYAFGYKIHVAVDQGSGLVRRCVLTSANVQEVSVAPALIAQADGTVYADRGYDSRALHAALAQRGLGDGIMRRGQRLRPLPPAEVARNHALAPVRSAVERVFGTLKRCYRLGRMRFYCARRNNVALHLACIAFNLRRWQALALS
jgi:IS5 family transposase